MSKKNKKRVIPKYEFGLNDWVGLGGAGAGLASGFVEDPLASGAMSGAVSGATTGMMFGPIGAGVGAIVGAGVGLLGGNKKKKEEQAMRAARANAMRTANARNVEASMAKEWYSDNPIANTYFNGGIVDNNLSFVNDGEIVMYPDDNTKVVNSKTNKTDDVLTSLPYGSTIFGGLDISSGETFSDYAKKIHNNNKKAEKDGGKYSKNSIELNNTNLRNVAIKQEQMKIAKNKKQGFKELPSFQDGGYIGPETVISAIGPRDRRLPITYNIPPFMDPKNASLDPLRNIVSQNKITARNDYYNDTRDNNFDWANAVTSAASLAPVAYNFANYFKSPEVTQPVENPYESTVINTMANRRFDNRALIEANKRRSSIANYNANQITGTGQNMAYRLANESNSRASLYDAIAQTSNMNNQYMSDYAQTLNSLGQQSVSARNRADEINSRNRAVNRAFGATAFGQLSQYAQNWNRDRKAGQVQDAMLDAYAPYLQSAYTSTNFNDIYKKFRPYGND